MYSNLLSSFQVTKSSQQENNMTSIDVIRAWKDPEYRHDLSEAERTMLPAHPAGLLKLTEAQLTAVAGGSLGGYVMCLAERWLTSNYSHEKADQCLAELPEVCGENIDGTWMYCPQ